MERRIARRYARALFRYALAQGRVAEVSDDLGALVSLFRSNEDFRSMLVTPVADHEAKTRAVMKLGGKLSDAALDFLRLVIDKNREDGLPEIHEEYEALRREHEGVAPATIISAVPLSEEQRRRILAHLAAVTGSRVLPEYEVDPSLIGGVKVLIGEKMIDGSVIGRLKQMRDRLYRDVLLQA